MNSLAYARVWYNIITIYLFYLFERFQVNFILCVYKFKFNLNIHDWACPISLTITFGVSVDFLSFP